jgi:DNA-binding transcriptional ArsR family regulator
MSILKQAGLVAGHKKGRWMYYRQADSKAPLEARSALKWLRSSLSESTKIQTDQRRLSTILKVNRDELCRRQSPR